MKLSVRSPDGFRARSERNSVVPLAMIYVRQRELANALMLCHGVNGVNRSRLPRLRGTEGWQQVLLCEATKVLT
jgi:hypothetical protein